MRNGRVVKGTNFEGIRDVADPVEMARMYNAAGADELVFYLSLIHISNSSASQRATTHPWGGTSISSS